MKLATPLRSLGKTTMQITPIGLGMMEMSGGGGLLGKVFPVIPQEEKKRDREGRPGWRHQLV